MSVQPIGPVEGRSPETYKIPVQKIDYVSAAWRVSVYKESGFLQLGGRAWLREFITKDIPTQFNPGALVFLFLKPTSGLRKWFLSWPASPLEGQRTNKRIAGLDRKVFFIKAHHFSTWNGIYIFLISKNVGFLSLEAKQWVRQRTMPTVICWDGVCNLGWPKQNPGLWSEVTRWRQQGTQCLSLKWQQMQLDSARPHIHYLLVESPGLQWPSNSSSPGIPKPHDYQKHLSLYKKRLLDAPSEAMTLESIGPKVPTGGPRVRSVLSNLLCYLPCRSGNWMCSRFYDAFSHKRFMIPKSWKVLGTR